MWDFHCEVFGGLALRQLGLQARATCRSHRVNFETAAAGFALIS